MDNKDAIIIEKDAIIAEQQATIAKLTKTIETLLKRIQKLEDEVARLKKDSNNSSKPPSSDIVKPNNKMRKRKTKKRKRGGQPGHKKHARKPFTTDEIDHTYEYELYGIDLVGLIPLDDWHILQQVTLPKKLYVVTEHKARKYLDPKTGKIIIASLPDEVQKGGLLGGDITAMTAFMKGGCHMSFSTIQQFFKEVVHLDVSRGMLNKATQKVSASLKTAYQQIVEHLPNESYLGIDETGHKDNGFKYWTWCFQSSYYSLFHIDKSRGSKVLFDLLGEEYEGIIGCDYWGAYRKFARLSDAVVQFCMAHLIREIRFLAEHTNNKLERWGQKLLDWIRKLFKTLHRSDELTETGFARRMEQIKRGFLSKMRRPPDHKLAKKLARRFKGKAAETYFRFMTDPNVEPTNNGTEREIRHTVIDRRITQGTRGDSGMRWCERIWTIIATCKKQERNVFDFIHKSLLSHWTDKNYPLFL
jgi:transposase